MGIQPPKELRNWRSALAIDFETANMKPESACALGAVLLEGDKVVARESALLRPYTGSYFTFTKLHGISWDDVKDAPSFAQAWPRFAALWEAADVVIAHNAVFDVRVLLACARSASMVPSSRWFACTLELCRRAWPEWPDHRLDTSCSRLGIPLVHHRAESDAEGCAKLFISGVKISGCLQTYSYPDWTSAALPDTGARRCFHLVKMSKPRKSGIAATAPRFPVTVPPCEAPPINRTASLWARIRRLWSPSTPLP